MCHLQTERENDDHSDMNGRTGEEIDYITGDSLNPYLPVPDDYTPDTQSTIRKFNTR